MICSATIKVVGDGEWWPALADGMRHPWQAMLAGSGLTLHAPLDLTVDLASMQAEFAALDADLGRDGRAFMAEDGSWTSIALVERGPASGRGIPTPAWERMPSVGRLVSRVGWNVAGCYLLRMPPHGVLPWHFEAQAPHLPESRVLVPLHAPAGAVTLIGDEAAAYPEGVAWAGDFNFPHQVENRSNHQRIVLLVDAVTAPEVLRLLPPALTDAVDRRTRLATDAANQLRRWRNGA